MLWVLPADGALYVSFHNDIKAYINVLLPTCTQAVRGQAVKGVVGAELAAMARALYLEKKCELAPEKSREYEH